jgi:hypothetical protein
VTTEKRVTLEAKNRLMILEKVMKHRFGISCREFRAEN